MFSFQAIKHITTGDGGMLLIQDREIVPKAERIRWFGIDRSNKQKGGRTISGRLGINIR